MKNFTYSQPTRLVFGKDAELQTGNELKKFGAKKALVHYGGGSAVKSGLLQKTLKSLEDAGILYVEFGGVVPNPRLSMVEKGIELVRREKTDFILAVGGGSVIDSSKAIAVGVPYQGDVWDFFKGKAQIKEIMPLATVLTIAAAGSESSASCVITNESTGEKMGVGSEFLRPLVSMLNPELMFTLPREQTAYGGVDMMAHIFERYFTDEPNVDFTDRLCEGALKSIIKNLPLALERPGEYTYRSELLLASTMAHNNSLSCGRGGGDWASHAIEHELSAKYDIAHGAGLAVIFPAWMKYVYKTDVHRFAQFAERVWDVEPEGNAEQTALEGIARTEGFFRSLGVATRLSQKGIGDDKFREMARCSTWSGKRQVGFFKILSEEDIVNIYKLAK